MSEEDFEDDGGGCLGEDDDIGEYEELLNEKLAKARELVDARETVESRDLLNDVINYGDEDQEAKAMAMIEELDIVVAEVKAEQEAKEAELAADSEQESSQEQV